MGGKNSKAGKEIMFCPEDRPLFKIKYSVPYKYEIQTKQAGFAAGGGKGKDFAKGAFVQKSIGQKWMLEDKIE
jgi:hypothetical protein